MTTAAGSSAQIEAYLAAVRAALSDIAEDERADLLAEVEASLVEAAGAGDRPIASLGPPEEFAAELRASAGLGEATAPVVRSPGALDAFRSFATELARRPALVVARRVGRELAPAWWLVRGFLLVAAVAAVTGAGWSLEHPWLPHLPSARWSLFLIILAVAGSLALGLRTRGARGALVAAVIALNAVALLAIVPVERHLRRAPSPQLVTVSVRQPFTLPGLVDNGRRITNLYPYSRTGTLLHDVLIYDQAGNRIRLGLGPDPLRRVLLGGRGQAVPNAFPIRYFDSPADRRVSHPDAAPPVHLPRIVTAPLSP
jgi:hypothetical protein